ncbi:hypothetical protein LEP3755_63680 (plasmid) [Leptolyngbya sp. NIES-3755]|nr:hypothetical protein LEP3755_63680 [Leptolyngbya sp. NIES-3755]
MVTKGQVFTFLGGILSAIALTTGTAAAQSGDYSPKTASDRTLPIAQKPDQAKPTPTKQSGCGCCKTTKENMERMQQQMDMMKKPGNSMPGMNHPGMTQ